MNKIKSLMIAMMAIITGVSFTACSDDDDTPANNYTVYQNAVTQTVRAQKQKSGNKKAILLVAFGSTWQQAFNAFDTTIDAYEKDSRFRGYDVFLSYSSAICINRAAAGENAADGAEVRNYYAPPFWLTAFAQEGIQYEEIIVQSLQVIPGEEYTRVINYVKDFMNNSNGDLSDDYLGKFAFDEDENGDAIPGEYQIRLGVPLLQDADADVKAVATALDALYGDKAAKDVVAFMGHGNPDSYDTYKANIRYTQLEEALQATGKNYFVGTVDMMENFKTHVYDRMKDAGLNNGTRKVYCHPLMSIDGDHGHNDMAGDDLPKDIDEENYTIDQLLALANEEGEVENCSWKPFFGAQGSGFTCNNSTMIEKGLLELPTVRAIWMNHTEAAEVLDYYHSKNPE